MVHEDADEHTPAEPKLGQTEVDPVAVPLLLPVPLTYVDLSFVAHLAQFHHARLRTGVGTLGGQIQSEAAQLSLHLVGLTRVLSDGVGEVVVHHTEEADNPVAEFEVGPVELAEGEGVGEDQARKALPGPFEKLLLGDILSLEQRPPEFGECGGLREVKDLFGRELARLAVGRGDLEPPASRPGGKYQARNVTPLPRPPPRVAERPCEFLGDIRDFDAIGQADDIRLPGRQRSMRRTILRRASRPARGVSPSYRTL